MFGLRRRVDIRRWEGEGKVDTGENNVDGRGRGRDGKAWIK